MKVLVDMNLSPGWASFLSDRGFESVHWSAVGSGGAPDTELMQWAVKRDYVVLTADLDFGAILAATRAQKPSVVQVRSGLLTPRAIGDMVVAALRQSRQELFEGALISLDTTRARLRILPLKP
jgi:predicted nuclease of predicted toxin-antitoxin system